MHTLEYFSHSSTMYNKALSIYDIISINTKNNSKHSGFVEDRSRPCGEDHRRFSMEDQRSSSMEGETR